MKGVVSGVPRLPFSLLALTLLVVAPTAGQDDPISSDERYSSAVLKTMSSNNPAVAVAPKPSVAAGRSSAVTVSKAGLSVGPNVVVNAPFDPTAGADLRGRSETTIASDPSGRFLVAGWNDAQGFLFAPFGPPPALGLSGYAYSSDGGATWTDGGAPFVFGSPGVVTRGDPWLDTGGSGQKTYYYANLAVFADGSPGGGISVHRGGFTGSQFAFDHGVLIPAPSTGDFLDKEALCAGKNNQTKDMVVVVTTNFEGAGGNGAIDAFVSDDRAATFVRTTVQLSEGAPLNQGADCVISKDGRIYVVWERGRLSPFLGQAGGVADPEIYISRSDNGGATFTPRMLVSRISSSSLWPPSGYNRQTTNDFPRVAILRTGKNTGRVFVAYQDSRIANGGPMPAPLGAEDIGIDVGHADSDVFVRYSDDQGATWSAPILIAGGGDGKLQFWPVVSADDNGRVNVTYNESVEPVGTDFLNGATPFGNKDSLVDVYYATSTDGGKTFSAPVKVTDTTTNWNRNVVPTNIAPNFGDYIFHVSKSNRVMATWADGRSLVMPEVFYATISPSAGN